MANTTVKVKLSTVYPSLVAIQASNIANEAANSATQASQQALNSAVIASNSATQAANSAIQANNSAANIQTYADQAANSATQANSSAVSANSSAVSANASAVSANSSATQASEKRNEIVNIRTDLIPIHLGRLADDTTANTVASQNGLSSTNGIRYYNSTTDKFRVRYGGIWTNESMPGSSINRVNPLQFNAVGDGINDDTVAVQAAVNASKFVELPVGYSFRITDAISVPDDVYILGPGEIFVDQSPYYLNCFKLNGSGSGCVFDSIKFRGATNPAELNSSISSNFFGKAITGYNVNNVVVKNCEFYNFKDYGFNVGSGIIGFTLCYNIKILNNYFDSTNYGQFDISSAYRVGDHLVDGNITYSNSDAFLSIATLYDKISSVVDFPNSANHIVTNNILIKSRWGVPLVPISLATFQGTIQKVGSKYILTVTSAITGTIAPKQRLSGIISSTAALPPGTLIQSPGEVAGTWEVINPYLPSTKTIPEFSTPINLTAAAGASFTGSISNKILTINPSLFTGYIGKSNWLFCSSSPLPEGTKVSTPTAEFTGSISGNKLTITEITGFLLADNTETIFGEGIPVGTKIVSQDAISGSQGEGLIGVYTISNTLSSPLTSRDIYVDNRWNVLSSNDSLSITNLSMTARSTDLGRHGIVVHYDDGYSYLNFNNNFIGNVSRHGVYLRGSTTKGFDTIGPDSVTSNYFVYCGSGPDDASSYSSGVRNESTLPTNITDNYFYKTGYYPNGTPGVQEAQDIETVRGLSNATISHNTCIGAKNGAMLFSMSIPNSKINNLKVIGNTIQNDQYGIGISAGEPTNLTEDIQILNNHITLTGADYQSINSQRSAGIWSEITYLQSKYSLRVDGNIITGTGMEASFDGVISNKVLTANNITGLISQGHKVTYQTASFTNATISNNILTVGSTSTVTGTILANGTEVLKSASGGFVGNPVIMNQLPIQGDETIGGKGRYRLSIVTGTVTSRTMTSNINVNVNSSQANFLGSISGTTLTVTEIPSGTIIPSATLSQAPEIFSSGVALAYEFTAVSITTPPTNGDKYSIGGNTYTVTNVNGLTIRATGSLPPPPTGTLTLVSGSGDSTITYSSEIGTRILSQITPLQSGETTGGKGRYTVSISQTAASAKINITNVWNVSGNYTATSRPMTSSSCNYGIIMPFGTDPFAGTSIISDNTIKSVQWGIASGRYISNIVNYFSHKKLGFEVVFDRNKISYCDNATFLPKQDSAILTLVNFSNVFDNCKNLSASASGMFTTFSLGNSLGQNASGEFIGEWYANAAPTSVSYKYVTGDRILNSLPTSGSGIGWICVSDGSPGTWTRYGATYLTGSATWDPPELVSNTSFSGFANTTVTVPGAALGDYVTGTSFSSDIQGLTLNSWVSAANTVTVRLQNNTTANVNLASGTIRVNVMKA